MYLIDIQCGSFVLCILLLLLESRSNSMTTLFILRNSFVGILTDVLLL
jgi:hypothetical protein